MMGVPTFYTRLLANPAFGAADCHSMRLFISGSAPLLPDTFSEFRRRTGHATHRPAAERAYFNASAPALATCASCSDVWPDTPMASLYRQGSQPLGP